MPFYWLFPDKPGQTRTKKRTESGQTTMAAKKTHSKWLPPRGIRYRDFPERSKPFYLIWTGKETGAEKSDRFDSAAARELAARALAEKRDDAGSAVCDSIPRSGVSGWPLKNSSVKELTHSS
jgi:hypothetical protein